MYIVGHGTTNDGNTARCFFKNAEKSAQITGIDVNLINRFNNILSVMASGRNINIKKFQNYGIETAKLFLALYPWFYMPASVHKILIHGAEVIRHALLPIGNLVFIFPKRMRVSLNYCNSPVLFKKSFMFRTIIGRSQE